MDAIVSQFTGFSIVCSTVGSGADQRKHQSFAWLASVREIPVNSPQKGPVTRKCFHLMTLLLIYPEISTTIPDAADFSRKLKSNQFDNQKNCEINMVQFLVNDVPVHYLLTNSDTLFEGRVMTCFYLMHVGIRQLGRFLKFHGIPWNSMELDKFHI